MDIKDTEDFDAPNIIRLKNVRKKYGVCSHKSILIDEENEYVECGDCGEKLNAIYVLARYGREETRLKREIKYYKYLHRQLEEKKRTKCQKCGKFTEVNIKYPDHNNI